MPLLKYAQPESEGHFPRLAGLLLGSRMPATTPDFPKIDWVALKQETFLGLSGPSPKRLLVPSLIDLAQL